MMTEACATGKRVHLYDTGLGRYGMREALFPPPEPFWRRFDRPHLKAFVYRQTMRVGPTRLTRDIRIIQHDLLASGRVSWLGEELSSREVPPLEDVSRAVARVRLLMAEGAPRMVRGSEQPLTPPRPPLRYSGRQRSRPRPPPHCAAAPVLPLDLPAQQILAPRARLDALAQQREEQALLGGVGMAHVSPEHCVVAEPLAALAHQPRGARQPSD